MLFLGNVFFVEFVFFRDEHILWKGRAFEAGFAGYEGCLSWMGCVGWGELVALIEITADPFTRHLRQGDPHKHAPRNQKQKALRS